MARHPELEQEIRAFFADQGEIDPLVKRWRACRFPSNHPSATEDSTGHRAHDDSTADARPGYAFQKGARQLGELGWLGGYRLIKELGAGGMGIVFLAEDTKLKRRIALKVMRPELAAKADARNRFLREARLAAALNHDNIISIHHIGEDNGVPFLDMPLLQGESLAARLARKGRLPEGEVLRIGREAAAGLAAAHASGMIHRDMKPDNIWLETIPAEKAVASPATRVKLLDFGLAREQDAAEGDTITQERILLGTPAYMSPEQADGLVLDHRSDLFSLGIVLYECATGIQPFKRTSRSAILAAVGQHQPPAVCVIQPSVRADLSDLIGKLLMKLPSGRPDSAQIVANAIRAMETVQATVTTTRQVQDHVTKPMPSRRKRWTVSCSVTLALCTIITVSVLSGVWLYNYRFQSPGFLSLPVSDYTDHRYPANSFAQQDGLALHGQFHGDNGEVALNSQENDLLRQKLKDLSNRNERALVIHISSLAICQEGKVYLLPADANADRPDTWLPLNDVLQAAQGCPTKNKLLILDIMKPVADSRLGVVRNEVADRVAQAVHEMGELSFWIYCACSPGQVSLTSEELRQSVFGYYLNVGLRGQADNQGSTGKSDGRVTVKELADYVTAKVDRWAVHNRSTRQSPLLLGSGENFELSVAEKDLDLPLDDPPDSYPTLLHEGWKLRDDWLKNGGLHQGPHVISALEGMLLWSEHRWRGGFNFDRVLENPITDLRRYQDQMAQTRPGETPRSRSLALAVAATKQELNARVVDELKDLVDEAVQAANATDPAPPRKAVGAKLDAWAKNLEKAPLLIAEAAYAVALADPRIEKLRILDEVAKKNQPRPLFAETVLLQRLATTDPKHWPTDLVAVRRVLRIIRVREQVVAGDPAALPWIMNTLEAARVAQWEGETLLFSDDVEKQKRGASLGEEAERLYATSGRAMEALQECLSLLDQATEFLPACALYLTNRPITSAGDVQSWQESVRAFRRLHQLLASPPTPQAVPAIPPRDDPASLAMIQQAAATLRDRIQILEKPFNPKSIEQILVQSGKPGAAPTTLLEIQALLSCPLIPAETRATLWKASVTLSRQLHGQMMADEADKDHPPAPIPPYSDAERKRFELRESERAASRAAVSIGLLYMGGMEQAEALDREQRNLFRSPLDADWNGLGTKLRIIWGRDVPMRMKKLLEADDLSEAACLIAVTPPLDPTVSAPVRVIANWRQRQSESAWRWLGDFYRQEASHFPDRSLSADFYRRAGDEYLQFAR
jgi:serine/threonine protein kinase